MPTEEQIERVAKAIDAVQLFSRFNDWTKDHVPGLPVEICRHGKKGEAEIVVVSRFSADADMRDALHVCVRRARALAAIEALNT